MSGKRSLKPCWDKGQPLTFNQACRLFDQLADMNDLALNQATDGCYEKAHLMLRRMADAGLSPAKAWITENTEGEPLSYTDPAGGSWGEWRNHVAVAHAVKLPDGKTENLVFDPSMFDGPVSTRQWAKTMNGDPKKVEICAFGIPAEGMRGDYTPERKTDRSSDVDALNFLKNTSRRPDYPENRITTASHYRQNFTSGIPEGKTWISERGLGPAQTQQPLKPVFVPG